MKFIPVGTKNSNQMLCVIRTLTRNKIPIPRNRLSFQSTVSVKVDCPNTLAP